MSSTETPQGYTVYTCRWMCHKMRRFSQGLGESLCRLRSSLWSQPAGPPVAALDSCALACCAATAAAACAIEDRWSRIWQTVPTSSSSTRWLRIAEMLMNLHARRLHISFASKLAATTSRCNFITVIEYQMLLGFLCRSEQVITV